MPPTTIVFQERLDNFDEVIDLNWWSIKQVQLNPSPHLDSLIWKVELTFDIPIFDDGEIRFVDHATGWDHTEMLMVGQLRVSVMADWMPAMVPSCIDIQVKRPLHSGLFQLPGGVISFTGTVPQLPTLNEGQHVVVHGSEVSRPGVVGPQQSATLGIGPGEPHGDIVNITWPNGTSSFHDRTKISDALPPEFFVDIVLPTRYTALMADED